MTGTATGVRALVRDQWEVLLIWVGHWNIHWISGTLYLLLPFIREGLGLSYTQAAALITVYQVVGTLANFLGGTLVDLTGRRVAVQGATVIVSGLALFAVGLSSSYLVAAALIGAIGAMNMAWHPAAISYLSIRHSSRRGLVIGLHAVAANFGEAMAPLAAGALLLVLDWQATAMINAVSAPLVGVALIALLGKTDREPGVGETRAANLRGYARDMVRLVRAGTVVTLCVLAGFRNMTQAGMVVFLPLYLADVLHLNPFLMGVAVMLMQVGGAAATPVAGALSDRVGRRPLVVAGLWGTTAIVIALPLIGDVTVFIFGVAALGFVMYAIRPVIQSWTIDLSPPELHGSVTSMVFGFQSAFAAAVPIVGGLIADALGLVWVFYFLAAGVVLANLLVLLVPAEEKLDPQA